MKGINFKLIITYLVLVGAMSLWGMSFIWTKQLMLLGYQPVTLVFTRLLIATAVLLPFFILNKKKWTIEKKDRKIMLLAAFFEPFIYFLGENYGLQRVSPGVASIIIATIPVFTPIFTFLFLKEKFSFVNIIGLFLSFLGIGFMITDASFNIIVDVEGLLLMIVAVVAAIGYAITTRKLAIKYDVTVIVFFQTWIGLFLFLPLYLWIGLPNFQSIPLTTTSISYFVTLAVLCTILAFLGYIYGIKQIGSNRASMFTNLIPVITVLMSVVIFNEAIDGQKLVGMGMVIVGLFATQIGAMAITKAKAIYKK